MGIRQALGADVLRLVRMVLSQSLRLVWWGLAFGVVACLALGRTMATFLYGVTPTDVPTLVAVILVILGVSVIASLMPALRAAAVQPSDALRED